MTGYAYKLVSAKVLGEPDVKALEKAAKRGWEPVPVGEEPAEAVNSLDMTPAQLENFRLHRMPIDEHQRNRETLEFLNAALADDRVHNALAVGTQSIVDYENQMIPSDEDDEDSPRIRRGPPKGQPEADSEIFRKRVEVARDWLKKIGR